MGDADKKRLKAQAKQAKKQAKADVKAQAKARPTPAEAATGSQRQAPAGPSPGVRYAEAVRGIIYMLLGASLVVALVLGQRGAIISLDDIIDSMFAVTAGKIVLALIAVAFVIYGLKHLRLLR